MGEAEHHTCTHIDARHIDAYQSRIFEKGTEAGLARNTLHMRQDRAGDTEQTRTAGGSDPFRLHFCDSTELPFVTLLSSLLHWEKECLLLSSEFVLLRLPSLLLGKESCQATHSILGGYEQCSNGRAGRFSPHSDALFYSVTCRCAGGGCERLILPSII